MSREKLKWWRYTCEGWRPVTHDPDGLEYVPPMVEICRETPDFCGTWHGEADRAAQAAGWTIDASARLCPAPHDEEIR